MLAVILLAATGSGVFDSVEDACTATIAITVSTPPGKDQELYPWGLLTSGLTVPRPGWYEQKT